MVQMRLKLKYRTAGKGQIGYRPRMTNGDSGPDRPNYKKCSDAQKKVISASQPKMVLYVNAKGKKRMVRADAFA